MDRTRAIASTDVQVTSSCVAQESSDGGRSTASVWTRSSSATVLRSARTEVTRAIARMRTRVVMASGSAQMEEVVTLASWRNTNATVIATAQTEVMKVTSLVKSLSVQRIRSNVATARFARRREKSLEATATRTLPGLYRYSPNLFPVVRVGSLVIRAGYLQVRRLRKLFGRIG